MQETYTGELLHPINFDPSAVLRPDIPSEYLGKVAFWGSWWSNFLSDDKAFMATVLVAGTGSGIIAAGALSERHRMIQKGYEFADFPMRFVCFDNSQSALEAAAANLKPYTSDSVSVDLLQADWRDPASLSQLDELEDTCSVFVTNPPYLTDDEVRNIRSGYENAPKSALLDSTGALHGTGEYDHLLPLAAKLIKPSTGSVIIGRFQATPDAAFAVKETLKRHLWRHDKFDTCHLNIKAFHHNNTSDTGIRSSYGVFLAEPLGIIDNNDGESLNTYWTEYIDPKARDRVIPNPTASLSYSTDADFR